MLNVLGFIAMVVFVAALTWATDQLLSPERRAEIGKLGSLSITTNMVQWAVIGVSFYAVGSWLQAMRFRDPEAHRRIVRTPTFALLTVAVGGLGMVQYSVNGFVFLYASRYLGFTPRDGVALGAMTVVASIVGLLGGGILGDLAKRKHVAGRIYLTIGMFSIFTLLTIVQYTTRDTRSFLVAYGLATVFLPAWQGSIMATYQDLVVPRMRGLAFATMALGNSIIGLGLGPYIVGLTSDVTHDLRFGILAILIVVIPSFACLLAVAGRLKAEET